jgi:8-oxo-dGTP pyrophosphatase MutT (NUDIX family)
VELTFESGRRKFVYRAGAIAVRDGRVLVHQWEGDDDFFCLPGGRVEHGESAEEALRREMREELACDVKVGRLLWVIENFFTHRDVDTHEIGMYFAIELPEGCLQSSGEPWTGAELDGIELYFSWHPVDRLHEIDLKPSFWKEALRDLPERTAYVVHYDTA